MAVLVSQKRRVAPVYRTATEPYIARRATKINPAPGADARAAAPGSRD
jgi:hypothetical protein